MSLENPLTFLRSIKGAPAAILLAFVMARKGLTNLELQAWTGYGHDAITRATHTLVEMGWLYSATEHGPWYITPDRQLLLGPSSMPDDECETGEDGLDAFALDDTDQADSPVQGCDPEDEPEETCDLTATLAGPVEDQPEETCGLTATPPSSGIFSMHFPGLQGVENAETCDLTATLLSCSSYINYLTYSNYPEQEQRASCDFSATPATLPAPAGSQDAPPESATTASPPPPASQEDPPDSAARDDPRYIANMDALRRAGVRQPMAGRLARMRHVNPKYIAAHLRLAGEEGRTLGTAIYRIRQNWPIAGMKPKARAGSAGSVEDRIQRFLGNQWRSQAPPGGLAAGHLEAAVDPSLEPGGQP